MTGSTPQHQRRATTVPGLARSLVRTTWVLAVALTATVGLVVAAVALDAPVLSGTLAGAAFVGGAASIERHALAPGLVRAELAVRHGLATALLAVAVVGLLDLAGPAVLVPLLVLVVTSPPVLQWRSRRRTSVTPTGPVPPLLHPAVSTLDDDALCRAWRSSFAALDRARGADALDALAARRADYLDELTRRDRAGVDRWLASGARAAGDPRPFLTASAQPAPAPDGGTGP